MTFFTRLPIAFACLLGALFAPCTVAAEDSKTRGVLIVEDEDFITQSKLFLQFQQDSGNNTVIRDELGDSDEDLDLGDGRAFSIGYEFYNSVGWKALVSLGYKRSSVTPESSFAGNTIRHSKTFETYPLELQMVYDQGWVEYGFGVTYHISPQLRQSTSSDTVAIPGQPEDISFDSQLGLVLQVELDVVDQFVVGLKYTNIEYRVNGVLENSQTGTTSDTIDADHASVYFKLKF